MPDARLIAFKKELEKVQSHLLAEYSKLQTGRANASLVEHVLVEAYGQTQPLKTIAGIGIDGPKTIVVQPWDPSILAAVEKALRAGNLGANPVNDGHVIRLVLPSMTEERRQQLTKVVRQLAEEARISVRQQRQTLHDQIKTNEKDEDARFSLIDALQKEVESMNASIDQSMKKKEEEVMKV
ncbi:TPA: ribosome recycling factor [Candidatus Peribacteria bacterium]|nr:MAG: ribosome recycling factor [Candidatus Peribacteria bacterium RIFOXYD2_FULL_58_15]OGJ83887.1 MAG: ribosome recycling factor [Candidatus Peribacteria bacterium RIFOXYC2_FULL_58_10]HAI98543.1 ribosome recycling factor [Candidatus Peribacteria bacterium]HAS34256.1 ribosome recycling factor [Candidatus Peribacteria bacterium]